VEGVGMECGFKDNLVYRSGKLVLVEKGLSRWSGCFATFYVSADGVVDDGGRGDGSGRRS